MYIMLIVLYSILIYVCVFLESQVYRVYGYIYWGNIFIFD